MSTRPEQPDAAHAAHAAHVEEWGLAFEQAGMPRIAGRIWGWLLICRPAEQSLTRIADELGVSKGSVSTNARLLSTAGLLERAAVPGSRQVAFRIRPDAYEALMEEKLEATRRWLALARDGLRLVEDVPGLERSRLERLARFYGFVEDEQEEMIRRWHAGG